MALRPRWSFSAYDFFDSDERHHWIAEGGAGKDLNRHGKTREAFLARGTDLQEHQDLGFGGRVLPTDQPYLPHFGMIIATCERGDLRLSPNGLLITASTARAKLRCRAVSGRPGQGDALDALWAALRESQRCIHDARWGRATVEIILAILELSRHQREVHFGRHRRRRRQALD